MPTRRPTIRGRILTRVRARGRGKVHIPQDFLDLGTRSAIDSALHRLVKSGELARAGRGLYYYPATSRFGPLPPDEDELVAAIGRRTGSVMQLAGQGALNRLGLSTQVPARSVYLTDGPSRTLTLDGRPIEFRHTSSRYLVEPGTTAGLVVQALRTLGRNGVDQAVLAQIDEVLTEEDRRRLRRAHKRLPAWIQDALRDLLGSGA